MIEQTDLERRQANSQRLRDAMASGVARDEHDRLQRRVQRARKRMVLLRQAFVAGDRAGVLAILKEDDDDK